ncbi:hypothetical protein GOP47_0003228 [Adiantum capillus-veneris]|uniref:Uncharacterized protein n=1 Tax=Adiantum capillus-veneris TaxID=13818 RepID=A0A9D4ZSC1_ADICA|nr:hypothetical protein GOP47_0003228 [Adiantum capillus-veneris]
MLSSSVTTRSLFMTRLSAREKLYSDRISPTGKMLMRFFTACGRFHVRAEHLARKSKSLQNRPDVNSEGSKEASNLRAMPRLVPVTCRKEVAPPVSRHSNVLAVTGSIRKTSLTLFPSSSKQ